ncbi:MAG TPA: FAD-binding oxidoreductase [Nitrososphaerales archaeon]|nr:FAD-binding oxidoreductase [Nitrososphaerales archaeon]
MPKVAYSAESEEDVTLCIREATAGGLTVTARGGGTSIPSQSVGRGAILIQARQKVEIHSDGSVECEPGVIKADLNRLLSSADRWMPVDPSSYASCTMGGMIANNSSGVRTMKYGSTVDFVESLRAVVPGESPADVNSIPLEEALTADKRTRRIASLIEENAKTIREDRPGVTKNSSGYRLERVIHNGIFDLPKLLVGSEGTLCVFTNSTIATRPPPKWRLLLIVESTLEELNGVADTFRVHSPSGLELVDKSVFKIMNRWKTISKYSRTDSPYLVFSEFDGDSGDSAAKATELAESKVAGLDPVVLTSPSEIGEAWEARSEVLSIAQEIRKGSRILVPGVEDLTVPPGRLADLVKLLMNEFGKRGLEYISYGHAGDANLHARPLLDISEPGGRAVLDELMEDCFEAVWKMGGTMTGEHGDGMLRARFVEKQYPKTYWIMKEIKTLFDPMGILNPGVKIV